MTDYIKIQFENIEPLKISDDSSSQSGQVDALSYVPGASMRGAVIGALVAAGEFETYKKELLSGSVCFLNGYIRADGHELIPSFKGFYEDKTDSGENAKEIENVLFTDKISDGNKRASLGRYCYVEDGCIFYTGVDMSSDMKINKGKGDAKKNVFRNSYVKPGYLFAAYIAVRDNPALTAKLEEVLEKMKREEALLLGGSRSFGYGKCKITEVEVSAELPYAAYAADEDAEDEAFLMLLSNLSMVNEYGECVGLDIELLRRKLGLKTLEIERCSTSIADVRGYNRTWGTMIPSVKMYEMGSVFLLRYPGDVISKEKMREVMDEGIGIRTAEGCGRVIFLNHYEKVTRKKSLELSGKARSCEEKDENHGIAGEEWTEKEKETLRIAAKGYFLNCVRRAMDEWLADPKNSIRRFNLNSSQLGAVASILMANRFDSAVAFRKLNAYFEAAQSRDGGRRVQSDNRKRSKIAAYLKSIQDEKLTEILPLPEHVKEQVMGFEINELFEESAEQGKLSGQKEPEELAQIKLDLILEQMKCGNREGRLE